MNVVELDREDGLACFRSRFQLPDGITYLDGNSLGPLPKAAAVRASEVIEKQWGTSLITSWNRHGWIDLPVTVGEKIAPLIGAARGQTICCDSISVNLFKLLAAALQLNKGRQVVLSQQDNFPTDLYMVEGLSELLGEHRCELRSVAANEIEASIDGSVAVLVLTQVNFRTGLVHDIERLTRKAHEVGALVIWDLAHSAGALPLELDRWSVDFAVGCGYKYLNGGPGAPAFVYVAERHQPALAQPLSGWMGHKNPFAFDPEYSPSPDVQRLLTGTPPIISMAVLDAALDVYAGVDIHAIRAKSVALTRLLIDLINQVDSLHSLECISPEPDHLRGSQVSYTHPDGYAIAQCLIDRGVIIDFRSPDIMRFGFNALYNSFADVERAVATLAEVLESAAYRNPEYQQKARVT